MAAACVLLLSCMRCCSPPAFGASGAVKGPAGDDQLWWLPLGLAEPMGAASSAEGASPAAAGAAAAPAGNLHAPSCLPMMPRQPVTCEQGQRQKHNVEQTAPNSTQDVRWTCSFVTLSKSCCLTVTEILHWTSVSSQAPRQGKARLGWQAAAAHLTHILT